MVTTESTLNGILTAWGMDNRLDHHGTGAPAEPCHAAAERSGQDTLADETDEGFGALIGRRLLGHVCDDATSGAHRIVEICRAHPVRPYLVEGGGRGFRIPKGWSMGDGHWETVKEFERLWWSKAGDIVVECYGDRLPTVCRDDRESGIKE